MTYIISRNVLITFQELDYLYHFFFGDMRLTKARTAIN